MTYHKQDKNNNCLYHEIIQEKNECEDASKMLGLYFDDSRRSSPYYPAGCHYSYFKSYFNEIVNASATRPGYNNSYGGVCKTLGTKYIHGHCISLQNHLL